MEGDKNLLGGVYWGEFFQMGVGAGWMSKFLADRRDWENSGGGVEGIEFPYVLRKEHVEIPQVKKEVGFSAVIEKKSCGISIGFGILPWNLQGVPHNFVEYPKAKFCFSRISKGKVTNGLFQKKTKRSGGGWQGVEKMEFPGISKK